MVAVAEAPGPEIAAPPPPDRSGAVALGVEAVSAEPPREEWRSARQLSAPAGTLQFVDHTAPIRRSVTRSKVYSSGPDWTSKTPSSPSSSVRYVAGTTFTSPSTVASLSSSQGSVTVERRFIVAVERRKTANGTYFSPSHLYPVSSQQSYARRLSMPEQLAAGTWCSVPGSSASPDAVVPFYAPSLHRPSPQLVETLVQRHVMVPVPKVIEKQVAIPVEFETFEQVQHPVPVEQVLHRDVPYPVEVIKHVVVPFPVEQVMERQVAIPVEQVVHRVVQRPVPVLVPEIVHVPVPYEQLVVRPVRVPVPRVLEKRVPVPVMQQVEKLVHVPRYIVQKHQVQVPVPVERIIYRDIPVPVEHVVERVVERPVPVTVPRYVGVPTPVSVPHPVEKIINRPVPYTIDRVVERHVPVPVDVPVPVVEQVAVPVERIRVVEHAVPVEQIVPQIRERIVPVPTPVIRTDHYDSRVDTVHVSYRRTPASNLPSVVVHRPTPSPLPVVGFPPPLPTPSPLPFSPSPGAPGGHPLPQASQADSRRASGSNPSTKTRGRSMGPSLTSDNALEGTGSRRSSSMPR